MARPERDAPPSPLDANRLGALWSTLDHAMDGAMEGQSPSSAAIVLWLFHWAPVGVVELSRVTGLSQPACTRAVDKLVDQGLVERETVSGKEVRLALTRKGRSEATRLQQRRLAACGELLGPLSGSERRQFAQLVDKILQAPVDSRAYAKHVCRFCDHGACDGPLCPVGCAATAAEASAGLPSGRPTRPAR